MNHDRSVLGALALVLGGVGCSTGGPSAVGLSGSVVGDTDPASDGSQDPDDAPPDQGQSSGGGPGGDSSGGSTDGAPEATTGESGCTAGERQCDGLLGIQICDEEGVWHDEAECDALQGLQCEFGHCMGSCASDSLGNAYVGCDYYPTITTNQVDPGFAFAVVVSNTSGGNAVVTVTQGEVEIDTVIVAQGNSRVIYLPWVDELRGAFYDSRLVADGAYRLRSTRPVAAYQYSPLQYTNGATFSQSNDASLLLPTNTWGDEYVVVARNTWRITQGSWAPGFYAVVAREDNTTIVVHPSATSGHHTAPGTDIAEDGTGTVVLDDGDVLQILSAGDFANPSPVDLTGTRIVSDKPIQVLAGHQCTFVPHNVWACDHLEDTMLPSVALGQRYVATAPNVVPATGAPFPKARYVRVVATVDDTTLAYDPDPGAATVLAAAGDYIEIGPTDLDFVIEANHKIVVAQTMLGQGVADGGNTGDPSLTLLVPTDQYRLDYLVHMPVNYESNWLDVVAPVGVDVSVDGEAIDMFTPIGASGLGVARVQVSNAGNGNHIIVGAVPTGVSAYGYGQWTSFWYPGGLDLHALPEG